MHDQAQPTGLRPVAQDSHGKIVKPSGWTLGSFGFRAPPKRALPATRPKRPRARSSVPHNRISLHAQREPRGSRLRARFVLIAQDAPRIEAYTRGRRGWRFEELEGLDAVLALAAFGIELPLAEMYDGLSFPAPVVASPTPTTTTG
jgi:hypothetical protein